MAIKDKWYSIGEVLKIPPERLNHFEGVTDPLLEVIVHWLKGGRDIPPTWSDIMGILRNPSINELELADKIHRIHCDHTQEKEIKEAQGFSGIENNDLNNYKGMIIRFLL